MKVRTYPSIRNNADDDDYYNTVKRVELTNLKAADLLSFVVKGTSIQHTMITSPDALLPQRWAVAVVGHFTGTLQTQYNPAYRTPSRLTTAVRSLIHETLHHQKSSSTMWSRCMCLRYLFRSRYPHLFALLEAGLSAQRTARECMRCTHSRQART